MSTNLAVYVVLYGFAMILIACMIMIVSWKLHRQVRERRDAPVRASLLDLPSAVVRDLNPPAAPRSGRPRRVARELVVEATFSLSGLHRERAVKWLEDNGYVAEATRVLLRPTNRSWRRAEAASQLGRMGSRRAAQALAYGLSDGRYRVRDACATALGHVATQAEVPALVEAVERRRVPRGILSGALLHLDPAADPALIACLTHRDESVRELVAKVLGMRRTVLAVPALMDALDDPCPPVRREALLAIAEISANSDVPVDVASEPLIRLSVDDASIVRAAAATGLGQILGDGAARVLTSMTRDPEYWVSYRAAESLCRLPSGGEFGWRILCDHDDTPGARRAKSACLEWLERTGGIEQRMATALERGGEDELIASLQVLESVGSRAWGELLTPPAPQVEVEVEVAA
jgi:HEAT repeat protein